MRKYWMIVLACAWPGASTPPSSTSAGTARWGIAVLASILTATYQSSLCPGASRPRRPPPGHRSRPPPRLGPAVAAQARTVFADGMHLALYIAAGIVAAAVTVSTLLRGHSQARPGTAG